MSSDPEPRGIDVRKADASYRSIPQFSEWLRDLAIADVRWDRYARFLKQRGELTPELLTRAREVAKRAAAIDTGAIEGLYEVDRGFTFTVAMQMATWEAQLDAKGAKVRSIIEAQLEAYDFVLDFATQALPVAEAWIRTLHEVMCSGQETYSVYTEVGLQEQTLPLGEYKALPNHVLRHDGAVHAYAPVDMVPAEMQRFCAELRSPAFAAAHPVAQSSYAHYAFVAIHPFADGNGRVARALASVFTYRALSVPLVILTEHRSEYYGALEAADRGNPDKFIQFVFARALDSMQLVSETLRAAGVPAPLEAAAQLKRVYLTQGGFSQTEVDQAGYRVLEELLAEVRRQTDSLNLSEMKIQCSDAVFEQPRGALQMISPERRTDAADVKTATADDSNYRLPVTAGAHLARIHFETVAPARTELLRRIVLQVPKDSGTEDDLMLRCLETGETFEARVVEAHPALTGTLQLRLRVFVHGFLGRSINEVAKAAEDILHRKA